MADSEIVAVLGAGSTMGRPMARNLARDGFPVRAWNRTQEKAEPLAADGVTVVDSPAEAAEGASVILTMLADTDAVMQTIERAIPGTAHGVLWLQMSTIGEDGTRRCIEFARGRGIELVDAPVLGTKGPAEQGKLVVLASGPEQHRARAAPIFDAVGQKTIWVGEVGSGTQLKLVANSWVLTVVEGCAETVALAQGLGLDPSLLLAALEGGALDLPYLRMKSQAITEGNFEPMFRLALAAKDAALVRDAARAHGLDLPLFETISQRMAQGIDAHGDEDMIATYFTSAPRRS
jgi:3-hydroxyisobutyrate dehydrogenase